MSPYKLFPGRDHYTCGEEDGEGAADLALDRTLDPRPGELDGADPDDARGPGER
jgi:hypothetical protein